MVRGGVGWDTDLVSNMGEHVVIGVGLHVVVNLLAERAGLGVRALVVLLVVGQIVGHDVDSSSVGDEGVQIGVPLVEKVPDVFEVSAPPGGRETTGSRGCGGEHQAGLDGLDVQTDVLHDSSVLVCSLLVRPWAKFDIIDEKVRKGTLRVVIFFMKSITTVNQMLTQ